MRSKRGRCWDAQQIVRCQKFVQTSKILLASVQCVRDHAAIQLLCQFEAGSDVVTKFRMSVGDPCAEATIYLCPLNGTENISPAREIVAIPNQLAQRSFAHLLAK